MHYNEHGPPHFHAYHGDLEAQVDIESMEFLHGRLRAREARLVLDWTAMHRAELLENWRLCGEEAPLRQIPPLE